MINLRIFSKYITIFILFSTVYSCRPHYEPGPVLSTENDFENILGWVESSKNNSIAVVRSAGYKSDYGSRLNQETPFGYIYRIKYSDISQDPLTFVKVKCMVRSNSIMIDSCTLVLSVVGDNGNILNWMESPFKERVKPNKKWVEFDAKFDLTGVRSDNSIIAIASWNHNSSQSIFLDDLKIEFY